MCLVPIEQFKPEYVGKLNFYLEVLGRNVKKPNENPSVGLLLCTCKDDTVVEYAFSRSMSQLLVSDYVLELPDKKILEQRFKELSNIAIQNS